MKALLVVDVQNDFCPRGALAVPDGDKIIPTINRLLDQFPLIIASKDWHPSTTNHFKTWPRHCVQNTKGAEFHPEFHAEKVAELFLKGTEDRDDGYSAFEATNLDLEIFLKEKGVTDLYLAGLATDYCVKSTARDAVRKGFQTYVITDAVAAVNRKPGDGEATLRELQGLGILLLTSIDLGVAFPSTKKEDDSLEMALYQNDRVFNEFKELTKIKPMDSITVDDLLSIDQMHYLGTMTLDEAAGVLELGPGKNLIDVGAGYGGPARYLASRNGCNVTCLELQTHVHELGRYFTDLVGLGDRVRHVCGDLLTSDLPQAKYDDLIALLVILHIPDKRTALQKIAELLKANGKIYLEDFYLKSPLTAKEQDDLMRVVSCPSLLTKDQYLDELRQAGFANIEFHEMNAKWLPYVRERNRQFNVTMERQISVHGKQPAAELRVFYGTIAELFGVGHLGGVRLVATKQ